jgi:hypothetical protein
MDIHHFFVGDFGLPQLQEGQIYFFIAPTSKNIVNGYGIVKKRDGNYPIWMGIPPT